MLNMQCIPLHFMEASPLPKVIFFVPNTLSSAQICKDLEHHLYECFQPIPSRYNFLLLCRAGTNKVAWVSLLLAHKFYSHKIFSYITVFVVCVNSMSLLWFCHKSSLVSIKLKSTPA